LLISVHIPKTAGTSLIAEIKAGKLGRHLLDNEDRPTSMALPDRLRRLRSRVGTRVQRRRLSQRYDVVHGHFLVEKYAFLYPQADFITFVREPVSRVLSHYYYFRDVASRNAAALAYNPDVGLVASGRLSLLDFARSDAMKNLYERFTRGLALEDFAMVGITERYVESVALLNRRFGTSMEARHERHGGHERHRDEYAPLLAELEAANRENRRIYDAALSLFEEKLRALA